MLKSEARKPTLPEALIVNPYDADQCAAALHLALTMSESEQRDRMRLMRGLIAEFNVFRWAGRMLLDAAAMRVGAKDSEAYLAEWRRADPVEVGDDLEAEADRAVATLVADFPRERVLALAANGGLAPQA